MNSFEKKTYKTDMPFIKKAILNEDKEFFLDHSITEGQGRLALEFAIEEGRYGMIAFLLEQGCQTKAHMNNVTNFIQKYDRPDVLSLLEQHGFEVDLHEHSALPKVLNLKHYKTAQFYIDRMPQNHAYLGFAFEEAIKDLALLDKHSIFESLCKKLDFPLWKNLIDKHQDTQIYPYLHYLSLEHSMNNKDAKKTKLKV